MKGIYLILIILSALFHALYNLLIKRSANSLPFVSLMFLFAGILSLPLLTIQIKAVYFSMEYLLHVYLASFFYSFYLLFVTKAYSRGDISVIYPLTVLSPVFVPLWASLFLGEQISLLMWLSISIAITGALMVKLQGFNKDELAGLFRFRRDLSGSGLAVAASFMYSIGAVFDKAAIGAFHITVYMTMIFFFIGTNLVLFALFENRKAFKRYLTVQYNRILPGGVMLFLSFYFFRLALKHVMVSIAVPVRLSSIIFAVAAGVILLKEKPKATQFAGIMVIIIGIILLSV